jgi:thymidine kinase
MLETNVLTPKFTDTFFPKQLCELYKYCKKGFWFANPKECIGYSGFNCHHFTMADMIYSHISKNPGSIVSVFGPMGSGKSAVLVMLYELLDKKVFAFYHKKDSSRNGSKKVISTWGCGKTIPAEGYLRCKDLIEKISDLKNGSVVLIDEWQFCDECKVMGKDLAKLAALAKEKKISLVISALDFSFKREPWVNSEMLVAVSDLVMVLTARCSYKDCKNPAVFTELLLDGEAASLSDDLVHIGKVAMEFFPKCCLHHRLKEDIKNKLTVNI